MKYFLVLVSLAVLCACSSACNENSNPVEPAEKEGTQMEEFYSIMALFSDPEAAPPVPGTESYRRCVKVRCPSNCDVCICRCIQWA